MYLGMFYKKSLYFKTADKAEHEGHFRWYCALVVHVPGIEVAHVQVNSSIHFGIVPIT